MKKLLAIGCLVAEKIKAENLSSTANDMSFKILLAIFPFLIFLLAVMGFFTLDIYNLTQNLENVIPAEILDIVELFTAEIVNVRRPHVLSTSLFVAAWSSTSGFKSLIAGINKAYGEKEERNFIKKYAISFVLVSIFAFTLVLMMIFLIFGGIIIDTIGQFVQLPRHGAMLFSVSSTVISVIIMLAAVILINSVALEKKVKFKNLLPGSLFTVTIWIIASVGFNIYVRNFSNMAAVYGSVAGVMVLMMWVNIICNVLLIGSAINAVTLSR